MPVEGCIHIVGIAGSGMSAVAEASLLCGLEVQGSDRHWDQATPVPVLAQLQAAGCALFPQDGSGVTAATGAVVVSTAIEEDNPDLVAARTQGIRVHHRTEWLAHLLGESLLLGIAGTSGKSTVTAMVGWILAQAGLDPVVVNGAGVSAWEDSHRSGQVRWGNGKLWVLELDESDRSLMRFHPQHAVITNQSADHFDAENTAALFAAFRQQVQGKCVTGPWVLEDYQGGREGCRFRHAGTVYEMGVLGRHNAANAVAATALCGCVGVSTGNCAIALRSFPGVRRRLERCLPAGQVTVFDDFAHNPAKIAAALDAVLPLARALTVIWRPHGYGPLRTMMPDLVEVFGRLARAPGMPARPHRLLLLPVYDAGGTASRDVQSGDLAALLRPLGVATVCLSTYDEIINQCSRRLVHSGDAVLVMGARDPGLPALARAIAALHAAYEERN